MTATKSKIVLAVVFLGAAAALAFYLANEPRHEKQSADARNAASDDVSAVNGPQPIGLLEGGASQRYANDGAAATSPSELLSAYKCRAKECSQSPFFANSEAEAIWLKGNGYPSVSDRQDAERLSTGELEAAAKSGQLIDMALYGERLVKENQYDKSLAVFGTAVSKGSIYALYGMSDVYAVSPRHLNPLKSKAFLRAAYLAGDVESSVVLAQRFPEFNNPVEQVAVDKNAARIHRNFMKHRTAPRPG